MIHQMNTFQCVCCTGGVQFIRWGSSTCPDTEGTQLLYSGQAGGSLFSDQGGGSNYLCLPNEPQLDILPVTAADTIRSTLYGAEYRDTSPILGSLLNLDVVCAACYSPQRAVKVMIPARVNCTDPSWTREYFGYLMSSSPAFGDQFRTVFECVDVGTESIPDSGANTNGALFYFVEARCGSLQCPPYVEGSEIPCVVCTK